MGKVADLSSYKRHLYIARMPTYHPSLYDPLNPHRFSILFRYERC
ncbi:hypothetical protein HMPREF0658_2110 [Hoylesella marshii DSM 16973 = JCM 13450]|uniref:Uncharacterized protein n=1 Tax=Hoylesella marshii DSM 16973 = JCM 13450 TaxID=862515 RepID=E0NVA5_9BACT|nr:hypothetical protein HMPREF0658_2110 [Hoylesella marshii DSM 16973 = JCM 13450]